MPTLRLRLGPARHLTGTAGTESAPAVPPSTTFALDLALGYPVWALFNQDDYGGGADQVLSPPSLIFYPELSYSYQRTGRHLFTAGGYIGAGKLWGYASYGLRFVAGQDYGETALGLRHGVGAHFLVDVFSVELHHQPLWIAGQLQHDLIVWFALNPLAAIGALMSF